MMKTQVQTQSKGINFLMDANSRKMIRTLILFAYFVIFQGLILVQKPFLQLDFIFIFYSTFSFFRTLTSKKLVPEPVEGTFKK